MVQSLKSETLGRVSEHFAIGLVATHHPLSGGNMAQTFKLETSCGRFVLRSVDARNLARVQARHIILSRLSEKLSEVVPVMIGAGGETTVSSNEGVFELSPFVEGRTWDHSIFPFDDEGLLEEAAALLARFHAATSEWDDPFQANGPPFGKTGPITGQMRAALADHRAHETAPKLSKWVERMEALSDRYRLAPIQNVQNRLLHGDYGYYNMIFNEKGTRVRALVDFDEARWGPVFRDVAYALYAFAPLVNLGKERGGSLEKTLSRTRRFLSVYERSGGRLDEQRLNMFGAVVSHLLADIVDVLDGLVRGDTLARKNLWLLHWHPEMIEWLVLNESVIRSAIED